MDGDGTMVITHFNRGITRLCNAFSVFVMLLCFAWQVHAEEISIDQHDKQFSPEDIVLNAGSTLVFTNHDNVTHNIHVIDADGDTEDKGLQKPSEIVKHTFTKPGVYQVRCNIHPDMLLMVTVK